MPTKSNPSPPATRTPNHGRGNTPAAHPVIYPAISTLRCLPRKLWQLCMGGNTAFTQFLHIDVRLVRGADVWRVFSHFTLRINPPKAGASRLSGAAAVARFLRGAPVSAQVCPPMIGRILATIKRAIDAAGSMVASSALYPRSAQFGSARAMMYINGHRVETPSFDRPLSKRRAPPDAPPLPLPPPPPQPSGAHFYRPQARCRAAQPALRCGPRKPKRRQGIHWVEPTPMRHAISERKKAELQLHMA